MASQQQLDTVFPRTEILHSTFGEPVNDAPGAEAVKAESCARPEVSEEAMRASAVALFDRSPTDAVLPAKRALAPAPVPKVIWTLQRRIIAGAALSALLAGVLIREGLAYSDRLEARRLQEAQQKLEEEQEIAQQRLQAELDRRREADERGRMAYSELSKKKLSPSAAAEQARLTQDAKAQAWRRYYKAPARCQTEQTVDCANDYIRARRAFEAQYRAP